MIPLDQLEAYLDGPALVAGLAGFGLVVGVLTGLFGVGGGFMVTPMLRLLFGINFALAVGSSLCFTIGVSSSGAARHARLRNFEPRSMIVLALTSMLGAQVGGEGNAILQESLGAYYDLTMKGLFIVLLAGTAAILFRGRPEHATKRSLLQRMPLGPRLDLPRADRPGVSLTGLMLVGIAIGLLTGLMGIGGGVLFMPLLVLVVGLTPHQAVGTSLGVVVFSSISGTVKYGLAEHVSLWVALSLLIGAAIGVQIGAWVSTKLHDAHLRRYFALLVLGVVTWLAVSFGLQVAG
ncbi:MAG: sulfite exporter TauE/SafE family protein [Planctomycetota bacterium]